jgi:beta-aspartyl-peptidase (threonine type)
MLPAMPKAFLISLAILLGAVVSSAQTPQAAIEKVLDDQHASWNRHDLDSFMTSYWNSPEVTFSSKGKTLMGWQSVFDRYRKTYQAAGAEMGKVEFTDMKIEMLGEDAAFVRGQFHLTLSDGKTPHGVFTLIFRKFPDGWKIVHDHTSAAEN